MDPVQYMIYLVTYGDKTPREAYQHAAQKFGHTFGQLEQMLLDARSNARDLLDATECFDV